MDLQWFADALASVVGLLTRYPAVKEGGFIDIMYHIKNKYVTNSYK